MEPVRDEFPHIHDPNTQPTCGMGCPAFDSACERLGIPFNVTRNEAIVANRAVSYALTDGSEPWKRANSDFQVVMSALSKGPVEADMETAKLEAEAKSSLPVARCGDCRWYDDSAGSSETNWCVFNPTPVGKRPSSWCREFIHRELGEQYIKQFFQEVGMDPVQIGDLKQWRFPTEPE